MVPHARGRRCIRIIVGAAFAGLALFLLRGVLAEAANMLIAAGTLAILLCPLCRLYEKKLPRPLAAFLCLLTAAAVCLGAVTAIAIPLIVGFSEIYSMLPATLEKIQARIADTAGMFGLTGLNTGALSPDIFSKAGDVLRRVFTGAAGFAGTAADLVIAAAVAWHMLVSRDQLALRAELIIPSGRRQIVIRGASEALMETMMYLRGQAIIALCVGVLSAFGLFIVGVPSAIPLGLTAGLLNMIPYLGPVIACVPVGVIALTEGILPTLLSVGVLIAVQQIDGLILSPRIVGSSTGFSPSTVMIAIFASGAVWGVPGMLVALPVMILIRTCVRVFVELGHSD